MAEPFIGQIIMVGFNFAPRSYAFANGQILSINSNDALFSLFGTTYGGDGRSTFGLPQLNSRVPIHSGNNSTGPGLPAYRLGQRGGEETVTLTQNTIPGHTHTAKLHGDGAVGSTGNPSGGTLASAPFDFYGKPPSTNAPMHSSTVTVTGGGSAQSHENRQPYLAINFCVALFGVYPSRN